MRFAPGYIHHFGTDQHFTRDQFISMWRTFYTAFPDLEYVPEDIVAEGDKVAIRYA